MEVEDLCDSHPYEVLSLQLSPLAPSRCIDRECIVPSMAARFLEIIQLAYKFMIGIIQQELPMTLGIVSREPCTHFFPLFDAALILPSLIC